MNKKALISILFVLIILGIMARILCMDKEITSEETDFINPAKALLNTGHPLYYHSEQSPNQTGLLQPPMYIYLISIFLHASDSEASARAVNIIFSIFTSVLIFLFCANLLNYKDKKIIGLIAATFFLINYYALSSSILIDIDILSMFFIFSFISCLLMYKKTEKKSFAIFSLISLLAAMWNRFYIALLVYICLGIYFYVNKKEQDRHFKKKYLVIGLLAGAMFIVTWGAYSMIIEPGNFFTFLIHNIELGSQSLSTISIYVGSFALTISQFIRLLTFPAIVLMLLAFFYFLKNNNESLRILIIYTFSIFLLFILIPRPAFGYPRYFASMLPGISILISLLIYESLKDLKLNKKIIAISILSLLISLAILILFKVQLTLYLSNGLIKATNLPDFLFNILASLPIILVLFFKKNRKKITIFLICALFISYSAYFDIGLMNHRGHNREVGEYLKNNTDYTDMVVCPKAVGYYSERRYYVNDFSRPSLNFSSDFLREYFIKSFKNKEMNDTFFWPKTIIDTVNYPRPSLESLNKAKYIVLYSPTIEMPIEKIIGEFYIYRLNR